MHDGTYSVDIPIKAGSASVPAGMISISREAQPDAFAAWLQRTNSQALKDAWTKDGVAMVPSQYPPGWLPPAERKAKDQAEFEARMAKLAQERV